MKIITFWTFVVAATCLCSSSNRSSSVSSVAAAPALNYDTIIFNLRSATSQSFTDFINNLRGSVKKFGDDRVHNIRILNPASNLDKSQRFVILQLSNWEDTSIQLAIDASNVNIVGYRTGDKSYFLSDAPAEAFNNVFKGTVESKLEFGSTMVSLGDNWESLSRAVQESTDGGTFPKEIILRTSLNQRWSVGNVAELKNELALMLFVCRRSVPSYFIRSVVSNIDDTADCQIPEPTVRIVGRNGLCVDVRDGKYNDGNPIQLYPCKFEQSVSQLWTLKQDGTIRSNGKCMTAYGFASGQYVMIYDCKSAKPDAAQWRILANGNIINPKSGLGLTASAGDYGTVLTLVENTYGSSQAWLASNNIDPLVATIFGFKNLCLQENGNNKVWLNKCSGDLDQLWALYADGSIRPSQKRKICLTSNGNSQGSIVEISSCGSSPGQRWVFQTDGTIMNLAYGLVVDVKGADPGLRQIIIWPPQGSANQMWLPLP